MRFEKAIVTSANKAGRSGIVALPGAKEIIENVRMCIIIMIRMADGFSSSNRVPKAPNLRGHYAPPPQGNMPNQRWQLQVLSPQKPSLPRKM